MTTEDLRQLLCDARKLRGAQQRDLEIATGASRSCVSGWENGQRLVTTAQYLTALEYLGFELKIRRTK